MSANSFRPMSLLPEWSSLSLEQAATARWLCDLDLRERFLTLPDYVQRLQFMQLGIVPLDATLFP